MKAPFHVSFSHLLGLLAALLSTSGAQVQDAFNQVGRGLQKEVQAIKQPIDETIAYVGNSQCANVKKLIGVDYKQVAGVKEPDLNELFLNFRSKELNLSFNLSSAARLLSSARGYNPHANLIIFLHGFTDDTSKDNFKMISDSFLSIGEFNILGLDSSSLIRWLYLRSTTYVRFIGERLGEVLVAMIQKGLNPKSIHLIGHSLGAHIASFAGKQLQQQAGASAGRISGLDPAGPCFTDIDPELRLNASDALFVDVIHTDEGVYGISDVIGHVDFFPNGGSEQPNCLLQTCSHSRVNELYAESIASPRAFLAKRCKDYDAFKKNECDKEDAVMGYRCDPNTRGLYFLRTAEDPPYGLGHNGTMYENNEGIVKNIPFVGSAIFG